ncbi:MAG: FlgD immunoglobulin-like domain containing protein [Candidatus Latescibacterota bacterium]
MRIRTGIIAVLLALVYSEATMGGDEDSSLLRVTDEEIAVDTGRFVAVIDRTTGMIERAHLVGSAFELVCQSGGFTLFYPEFEIADARGAYNTGWTRAPGYVGTTGLDVTIQADDPDLAIVHVDWTTDWMVVRWTYRFYRGAPHFVVDTEREILQTAVYVNAQQCVMFTNDMDDSYLVGYGGGMVRTVRNRKVVFLWSTCMQHSMFSAIDEGLGTRYPAMVWYDRGTNITGGVLVTWVSPNQRESISYHGGRGGTQSAGVSEGQWNWFGKSDNESLFLRVGTKYGMRLTYYLDYGGVEGFDRFNKDLFNETHYDIGVSEDYWAASWGGRSRREAQFSWHFPQATNNAISSQELFRNRAIGLPRSQNGTMDPHLIDLSVKAVIEGEECDLTPFRTTDASEPLHAYARTVAEGDTMTGEVGWEVAGLQHAMRYTLWEESDQLVVSGDISPMQDELAVQGCFVELAFAPRVASVVPIGKDAWDFRSSDAVYGSVGMVLAQPTGIDSIAQVGRSLRLYLKNHAADTGSAWRYRFVLFPHLRNPVEDVEDVPPLDHRSERCYREYYSTLPGLEERTDFGICPDPRIWAVRADLDSLSRSMTLELYADPGVYPLRLFFSGEKVDDLRENLRVLPKTDWSFDRDTRVLEVRTNWSGRTLLEVAFGSETAVETSLAEPIPSSFALSANVPNPFNNATIIRYDLPEYEYANLAIYSLLGQRIRVLVDGHRKAGSYMVTWDGKDEGNTDVASGVYLVRMEMGKKGDPARAARIRKMALLR